MNKNSFLQSKLLRSNIALFAIVAMFAGFFLSRAVLSVAMMLFGLNALLGISPGKWIKDKWWLLGVIWVGLYIVSYFWSDDIPYWYTRGQVKLPVVLLPLAFTFTPVFDYRQLKVFTIVLCSVLFIGIIYSLSFLLSNPDFYIKGYIYSNVIPTLPENDYIRFSLSLAMAVVWCVYFFPATRERWLKRFLLFAIIVMSITLHILAVRTGLLALYLFIVGWSVYLACRSTTRKIGVTLIIVFLAAGAIAINYVPTLKNKIGHFNYTLIMFREGNMSGDYSDIGRYMSYDIALKLIRDHPLTGVGAGDILGAMKQGYDKWYPQVPDQLRLVPHNQFLTVGLACGIPGLLVFIAWVLYPLFHIKRNRSGFFFLITWLILLVPLMVEPVLEIQYGVFVYLFFLLWQYHAMVRGTNTES